MNEHVEVNEQDDSIRTAIRAGEDSGDDNGAMGSGVGKSGHIGSGVG